jgi:ribosomal protein S18 acetylase RimI-like enzyme
MSKWVSDLSRMIRKATEDDVARIVAIAHAAYIEYVPRLGRKPPPMLADFAAEVAAGHVVVIEVARAVEGYLISWPKMEAYFIDNIAVDPAHQGLGMGRQLMEYAVHEAKRHNLSAIQLYTNATMTENLAMYANMGFVETHRVMETQFHIETGFPRGFVRILGHLLLLDRGSEPLDTTCKQRSGSVPRRPVAPERVRHHPDGVRPCLRQSSGKNVSTAISDPAQGH